jgi:hypothetical protein
MMYIHINYLAVLSAASASYILGWLWFGPLFGKTWMRLEGITEVKPSSMDMAVTITGGIVGSLLMSWVLAHSIIFAMSYTAFMRYDGIPTALTASFWTWLGFIAPVTAGSVLYNKKPWSLWLLNNAYWLVSLIIMGFILSVWR